MIKVLSFVGSCAGEESHTAKFSDMVAAGLQSRAAGLGEVVSYECVRGDEVCVEFCRGCESCFKTGVCPLDGMDDVGTLKHKILEADILLFCSPVYMGMLSGMAKAVLDRLSYWTHRMELAGKTCAVLVTTSGSCGPETADAIRYVLLQMGASVAYAGYACRHTKGVNINLPEQVGPEVDTICETLLDCWHDPASHIDAVQEELFVLLRRRARQLRAIADAIGREPTEEVRVWERRGIANHDSLSAYVRSLGRASLTCGKDDGPPIVS